MIDPSKIGFSVIGPFRHSDGSFALKVFVLQQPSIVGGMPEVIGTADCHVRNNEICAAMAQALANVAQQLPPELIRPDENQL